MARFTRYRRPRSWHQIRWIARVRHFIGAKTNALFVPVDYLEGEFLTLDELDGEFLTADALEGEIK